MSLLVCSVWAEVPCGSEGVQEEGSEGRRPGLVFNDPRASVTLYMQALLRTCNFPQLLKEIRIQCPQSNSSFGFQFAASEWFESSGKSDIISNDLSNALFGE